MWECLRGTGPFSAFISKSVERSLTMLFRTHAMQSGLCAMVMELFSFCRRPWKVHNKVWDSQRSFVVQPVLYLLLIFSVIALVLLPPTVSRAESPADAISRIRQGPYVPMPSPQMAAAYGAPGKGMSIENRTNH